MQRVLRFIRFEINRDQGQPAEEQSYYPIYSLCRLFQVPQLLIHFIDLEESTFIGLSVLHTLIRNLTLR
jgi:hypothetical protein